MQIDWWTLGLQTINFLVVVWLLSRFLYRPIRKVIEEREAADRAASAAARKSEQEAEDTRKTFEAKLAQLDADRQKREAAEHKALEEERAKRLEAADAEAAARLDAAREKIASEERATLENLKAQVIALAKELARKAITGGSDPPLEQVKAYLDALPAKDLDALKAELGQADATVSVTSAAALPEDARATWRQALSQRFGPELRIDFTEQPDLLQGFDLHFPHAVFRFSAADRLERAAKKLEA